MNPGTLLIRADANVSIGAGHVMRCLALAQAWQDRGGEVHWVASELPGALADRLTVEKISLTSISVRPGSPEDAAATIAESRRVGVSWVVIDGERFGSDFLGFVHVAGLVVLLIDDFADRQEFPVNLIVNPNLRVNLEAYRARSEDGIVLAGPQYCLLRREFRETLQRSRGGGNRVLVSLGGSDPDNLTPRIAAALAAQGNLQLTLAVGPASPVTDRFRQLSAPNVRVIDDVKNMAELAAECDMAVIAAGGTLWEMLAVGCPVLSYARNTLQKNVVQLLAQDGVIIDMGETEHFDPEALALELVRLSTSDSAREKMAKVGRRLVDGTGAVRVVAAMLQSGVR